MKNLRGILVAAVFLGLTALLKRLAVKYGLLMHVAYPFFSKTVQEILGSVTSGTAMCVWQVLLAVAIARSGGILRADDPVPVELLPLAGLYPGASLRLRVPVYRPVGPQLL